MHIRQRLISSRLSLHQWYVFCALLHPYLWSMKPMRPLTNTGWAADTHVVLPAATKTFNKSHQPEHIKRLMTHGEAIFVGMLWLKNAWPDSNEKSLFGVNALKQAAMKFKYMTIVDRLETDEAYAKVLADSVRILYSLT